ncbi:hypothetical protein PYW07_008356 [Mythimna separata]|uniref:Peptidase S1 domain-containing protein n=1 Tax=Mythimna separata TaxID=271217 RepID=A0AAD7YCI6_MYTSE|nr:hypothetical protein PYW07_008356 [Mythimna separata]
MNMKSVCLWILVFTLQFVCGQHLTAPCDDVFSFEGIEAGVLRGKINVMKPVDHPTVYVLEVRINFTIAGPIINEYRGHVTPTTTNLVRKYNEGELLKYRVHFPATELRLPKITAVIINGKTICTGIGDDEKLGKRITAISIRHRSSNDLYKPATTKPVTTNPVTTKPVTRKPATHSTVTRPFQNNHSPAPNPLPEVNVSKDHLFSYSPITSDVCGVVADGNQRVPLIYNGKFFERGQIPWLVAIYRIVDNNLQFICGGTLVSDRHVVTAAHCMQRPVVMTPKNEIVVKLGVHSLNDWADDLIVIRKLIEATIHEEFNPNTLQNDILILTLNQRVNFNRYIRPACLWSGDTELSRIVGDTGVVAGWGDRGTESIGGKQDEPQMVRVPIVSTKECRASKSDFHQLTYNTTLCAGDRDGRGPCKGDSGSGLYLLEGGKWRLRGVVSLAVHSENGARTCNLNEYVVYTDTAQFLLWIRNILSQKYYD